MSFFFFLLVRNGRADTLAHVLLQRNTSRSRPSRPCRNLERESQKGRSQRQRTGSCSLALPRSKAGNTSSIGNACQGSSRLAEQAEFTVGGHRSPPFSIGLSKGCWVLLLLYLLEPSVAEAKPALQWRAGVGGGGDLGVEWMRAVGRGGGRWRKDTCYAGEARVRGDER